MVPDGQVPLWLAVEDNTTRMCLAQNAMVDSRRLCYSEAELLIALWSTLWSKTGPRAPGKRMYCFCHLLF